MSTAHGSIPPNIPKFRVHKGSGQALVQLSGRRFYLGRHDTPDLVLFTAASAGPHQSPGSGCILGDHEPWRQST